MFEKIGYLAVGYMLYRVATSQVGGALIGRARP